MSPVSRGRKPKKSKKSSSKKPTPSASRRQRPAESQPAAPGSALESIMSMGQPSEPPEWFGQATEDVLANAQEVLPQANGPRELEETTAELLGEQLHRALHGEDHGLFFERWASELVRSAESRCHAARSGENVDWEGPWLLLHGLTSIAPPGLAAEARRAHKRAKVGAPAKQRKWLWRLPRIAATGEVWRMSDVYGSHFGVLASYSYPDGVDEMVFLFDIDTSGFIMLLGAGTFDDLEQAAAAWRTWVGDTADDAEPVAVDDTQQLRCLLECDIGEIFLRGDESRNELDNWFRANRRIHDLGDALRKRGTPLPESGSLFHDIDPEPMKEAFTTWYTSEHGHAPHEEATDCLALEWMEGALPETWYAASPARVQHRWNLINDWLPGEMTTAASALLPEWARWLDERAGLPERLVRRAMEPATPG